MSIGSGTMRTMQVNGLVFQRKIKRKYISLQQKTLWNLEMSHLRNTSWNACGVEQCHGLTRKISNKMQSVNYYRRIKNNHFYLVRGRRVDSHWEISWPEKGIWSCKPGMKTQQLSQSVCWCTLLLRKLKQRISIGEKIHLCKVSLVAIQEIKKPKLPSAV